MPRDADSTRVVNSLTEIDEHAWERLATPRLYSSYRWLRFCERDPTATLRYLVSDGAAAPRAALPIHDVTSESNPLYRWQQVLSRAGLPVPAGRYLVFGTRRGYQSHLLADPDFDPAERRTRATELLSRLARNSYLGDAVGSVGLFLPTEDARLAATTQPSTCPLHLADDAWLPLPGSDFNDYLDTLSAGRRGNVRREERSFAAGRYRVTHATLAACASKAGRLLALTESRYGNPSDVDAITSSLVIQGEMMGNEAEVLLLHDQDTLIGFCLFYIYGGVLFLRTVGFDYGRLRRSYEYFNLTYYLPIRLAYQRKVRAVHAGIEAAHAKAMRGACLRPLWLLMLGPSGYGPDHVRVIRRHNQAARSQLAEQLGGMRSAICEQEWEGLL